MAKNISEIRQIKVSEFPRVIKFVDKIFKRKLEDVLPRLYKQSEKYAAHHYAFFVGKEIIAIIAIIPSIFKVGDIKLKAAGVGTVSVHPNYRNRGLMTKMMRFTRELAVKEGYVFVYLTGMRKRYENYGYYPTGSEYSFTINPTNVKYYKYNSKYAFAPLKDKDSVIEKLYKIYSLQATGFVRNMDEFALQLRSNSGHPFVVVKNNVVSGYVVLDNTKSKIVEICVIETDIREVVCALFEYMQKSELEVVITPYLPRSLHKITRFAEKFEIKPNLNVYIEDFKSLITALLTHKDNMREAVDGTLVVAIETVGTIKIVVNEMGVSVSDTIEEPDVTLTREDATISMFSPWQTKENLPPLFHNWFPLALYVPNCDKI